MKNKKTKLRRNMASSIISTVNTRMPKRRIPCEIDKYTPVLIHWVESQKIDEKMRKIGDFHSDFPENCYAVGFLVSENLGNKILIPLLQVAYPNIVKTGSRIVIPDSSIREIVKMKFTDSVIE